VKRIPIDQAVPGQILAEKLARHDGVLLASQGSAITEGLLRMLSRLNVDSVVVEEDESRTEAEVLDDYRRLRLELDRRFVRIGPQSVLQALKKTMIYLADKERDETLALINNPPSAEEAAGAAAAVGGEGASDADPAGRAG
jgi:hypothetical protein